MSAANSYSAKLIPIKGYIHNSDAADRRVLVNGFAFQVRDFEFCRTWLTRGIDSWNRRRWMVTHWESGHFIGSINGYGAKREAIKQVRLYLSEIGAEKVREKVAPWINGEASPTATHALSGDTK